MFTSESEFNEYGSVIHVNDDTVVRIDVFAFAETYSHSTQLCLVLAQLIEESQNSM